MKKEVNNLEEIKLFCEKHKITLEQVIDGELIGGALDLRSLAAIPDNTTFNVGGALYLRSLATIPDNTTFNVGGSLDLRSLAAIPDNTTFNVGGYLDLRSLAAIPDNTTFNVGGALDLRSLAAIPDNTTFNVGGYLDLESVTTIPDNITFNVGGYLDLGSVTTIPDNITFNVGGSLDLRSLAAIPDNTTFNVGGYLDLPKHLTANNNGISDNFEFESKGVKYIYADRIMAEIIENKGNVYHIRIFGSTKESFLITDGKNFSHGATLKEAKEDLIYKITDRKISDYNYLKLDTILTFEEAIKCYRTITGACSQGTKNFVTSILSDRKDSYSVKEIIELTKGQYGSGKFINFIYSL